MKSFHHFYYSAKMHISQTKQSRAFEAHPSSATALINAAWMGHCSPANGCKNKLCPLHYVLWAVLCGRDKKPPCGDVYQQWLLYKIIMAQHQAQGQVTDLWCWLMHIIALLWYTIFFFFKLYAAECSMKMHVSGILERNVFCVTEKQKHGGGGKQD